MSTAQLAAVSYLARYSGRTHTLYAAVHGNLASYHIQCGHRPIMLFRPNVRTAIRADVLAKSASHRRLRTRPRTAERTSVDAVQVPGSVGGERGWAR